jgi:hypothetical protein
MYEYDPTEEGLADNVTRAFRKLRTLRLEHQATEAELAENTSNGPLAPQISWQIASDVFKRELQTEDTWGGLVQLENVRERSQVRQNMNAEAGRRAYGLPVSIQTCEAEGANSAGLAGDASELVRKPKLEGEEEHGDNMHNNNAPPLPHMQTAAADLSPGVFVSNARRFMGGGGGGGGGAGGRSATEQLEVEEEVSILKMDYLTRGGKDSSILEAIGALEQQARALKFVRHDNQGGGGGE